MAVNADEVCRGVVTLEQERDNFELEADALRAQRDSLLAALECLRKAARNVNSLGAVTGPQWTHLTAAILKASSAIAAAKAQEK